jgi:hypothetical protein
MTFQRIGGAVMQYESALPEIEKANQAIDGMVQALAVIQTEVDSIIELAKRGEGDAAKMIKQMEALRHRRLAALMQAVKIPMLKAAAQVAVRQAAAEGVEMHRQALETHQAQLADAAKLAGYQEGDRQWISMMAGDQTLASIKRFMAEDKSLAFNFTAMTEEDMVAAADIQTQIIEMLK